MPNGIEYMYYPLRREVGCCYANSQTLILSHIYIVLEFERYSDYISNKNKNILKENTMGTLLFNETLWSHLNVEPYLYCGRI